MGVVMEIHPSLPKTDGKLSHFQILLLTLMRLRLNLRLDHIAHIFDISRHTHHIHTVQRHHKCALFTPQPFGALAREAVHTG